MTATNIFDHAADKIERRGWVQGGHGCNLETGARCAVVALEEAKRALGIKPHQDDEPRLWDEIGSSDVIGWNDRKGQTKENVIATLRRVGATA